MKTVSGRSRRSFAVAASIGKVLQHPVAILIITAALSQLLIPEVLKILSSSDQKQVVCKEFAERTSRYLAALENVLDLYNRQIVDPKQVRATITAYNDESTAYNSYLRIIKINYATSKTGYFRQEGIDQILAYRKEIESNLTRMINAFAATESFLSPTLWQCMSNINQIIDKKLPQTMEKLT